MVRHTRHEGVGRAVDQVHALVARPPPVARGNHPLHVEFGRGVVRKIPLDARVHRVRIQEVVAQVAVHVVDHRQGHCVPLFGAGVALCQGNHGFASCHGAGVRVDRQSGVVPQPRHAVEPVHGLVFPTRSVGVHVRGKLALGELDTGLDGLDILVLVSLNHVVVDVEHRVEQRRPIQIPHVGVGVHPLVEVVVAARLDGGAVQSLPIRGVVGQAFVVCREERRVGLPLCLAEHAVLVGGAHLVGRVVQRHHIGSEVVDRAVPALGARHVHKRRVVVLVQLELEVRPTPGDLAVVMVIVLVARSERRVEVGVLVATVIWGVVVVGPEHVANRPVVTPGVVTRVHPRTQRPFVVQCAVEVGQRPKPTVVVVRDADEVGPLPLAVLVHVQSVGTELKELVRIPRALHVNGAVLKTRAWRARQCLSTPAAEAGVGRGGQGGLV